MTPADILCLALGVGSFLAMLLGPLIGSAISTEAAHMESEASEHLFSLRKPVRNIS